VVINVDSINDAPVMDNSGDLVMDDILKNDTNNVGMLVEDLLASDGGDPITDVDAMALEGIAVITYDDIFGNWQYSLDGGTNWSDMGFTSGINVRLLAADGSTRLRFVPDEAFIGTLPTGIVFYAWDQSGGRPNGGTADTSENGDPTAFSVDFESASISVLPRIDSKNDFDGDNVSDITVFEPSTGNWFVLGSTNGFFQQNWGFSTTLPVPADYDGDGLDDIAIWDPATGNWFILQSSSATLFQQNWGYSLTLPVPGDYDGDTLADIAVFEPSTGNWYILGSSVGFYTANWGYSLTIPVPGDYDGDGITDLAVFDSTSGTWFVLQSKDGQLFSETVGSATSSPVPCDYDGDGCCDLATFSPSTGVWTIRNSSDRTITEVTWGYSLTFPVPGDYDGDTLGDVAVFEPSTGNWYILGSTAGFFTVNWGYSLTVPVWVQHHINAKAALTPPFLP
jgi:hypothetical protein